MPLMGQPTSSGVAQGGIATLQREMSRKRIVRLIMLVYWLLIFEGALRKWVLPEFSNALFFIRDPFVLLIYFLAFKNRMWPKLHGFFAAVMFVTVIATLLIPAQLAISKYSTPLLAAYGWRNYFFYIPLAFIIRDQFSREDFNRMMKYTMILSIPVAALVTVQFFSPPGSWINVQAFSGVGDRLRPPGTFSSVVGQWMYVASLVTFLMIHGISRSTARAVNSMLVLLAAGDALVCIGVSISRGTLIQSVLIVLSAIFAGTLMRGGASKVRAWIFPAVIVLVGIALVPIVLPEAYETTVTRWSQATAVESQFTSLGIIGRFLYGFIVFFSFIPVTPAIGFGIGLGGNASHQLEGIKLPVYAEEEWSRHIVDLGPIFGVAFILLRLVFTVILGVKSIKAVRRSGDPSAVIIFGFIGISLLNGQVTGHGTVNGYTWIFVGILMATIRWAEELKRKTG